MTTAQMKKKLDLFRREKCKNCNSKHTANIRIKTGKKSRHRIQNNLLYKR